MDRVDQRGFNNQPAEELTAAEAARTLRVKLETLYAYASRGLVRSVQGPKGRGRRYLRSDIERLKARGDARAGHGPVAAGALRWGEPVLATAISAIRDGGPTYRGHSAVDLASRGVPFEAVADLLWSGALDERTRAWSVERVPAAVRALRSSFPRGVSPLRAMLAAVPRLALADGDRFGASREAEWARARRLVRVLAAAVGGIHDDVASGSAAREDTVAASLAVALGLPVRATRDAIDRTLVLVADHELNASTFAGRVVASTGADLYACITGALAALTGPLHGGASDRVEALVDEVGAPERAREVLQARTSRGDAIPGFGHPLYPAGDPRTAPLMALARELGARARKDDRNRLSVVFAIEAAVESAGRGRPNLDFGLVAVARALGMRRGSASILFATGRIAGWVAHALEQREAGYILRPRAEYVGR
jgi:citrate synthase